MIFNAAFLRQFIANAAGSAAGVGIMPDRTGPNQIEPASRALAPQREPVASRTVGAISSDAPAPVSNVRALEYPRPRVAPRLVGAIGGVDASGGSGSGGSGSGAGSQVDDVIKRLYSGDDPFSKLADLALRLFGADNSSATTPTQYSVVPTQVGGGSSGTLLIVLVLALAGFGVYWFYFREA